MVGNYLNFDLFHFKKKKQTDISFLALLVEASLSPPMKKILSSVDLLLKLKNPIEQSFSCWRTTRNVNVYRNNPVTATNNRVGVMVVATTIGTASHGYHPSRLWHLIINLAESRSHLIGESPSNNHAIRLPGAGPKNDPKPIEIIASSTGVHHFHGAASQPESHGPHGSATSPVH